MGVWVLAMQESVQNARRAAWGSTQISRAEDSRRQHRAGLVLVGAQRRIRLQQQLPRSEGDDRRPASRALPPDDLCLALLRAWLVRIRLHGEAGLVHRQIQICE